MKQSLTKFRDTVIHDFDGAQYEILKLGENGRFFATVKAEITGTFFPDIPFEERLEIGDRSYRLTGDPLRMFVSMAAERGHDPSEFQRRLHHEFHRTAFQRVNDKGLGIFKPCGPTNKAFELAHGRVRHGLLTQGSVETWARPAMEKMERAKFFDPDCFIGAEDFGFVSKAQDTAPIEAMMKRMNAEPARTIFLDDSTKCLQQAKLYDDRIYTVLVSHRKMEGGKLPYVDLVVPSVGTLLRLIDTLHPSPKSHRYKSGQLAWHQQ